MDGLNHPPPPHHGRSRYSGGAPGADRIGPDTVHCPALFVSAPASGQGKTTVTAALARFHARAGRCVRVFKTGPDFLDPKILEQASGNPVFNVDCWMIGIEQSRDLLFQAARTADLILIEGAMGLFDGDPSPADLAIALGVPVAAVIDTGAMAETFGAIALGLRSYRALPFAGVIANRVAGPTHARMLRASLPVDIALIAAVRRVDKAVGERHLGLIAERRHEVERAIDAWADAIGDSGLAGPVPSVTFTASSSPPCVPHLAGRRVAVACDDAFSFIYPANLQCLKQLGAEIVFFSPLADHPVPRADAVYLPGGYPELHVERLTRNLRWQRDLREHAASKRPVIAECGGMMTIMESLVTADGARHAMAGLLPGSTTMKAHLTAIGLHAIAVPQGQIRGHSFHHSMLQTPLSPTLLGVPHGYGNSEPVYQLGGVFASYVHMYFPSNPDAVAALFAANA
jgi:cobyrinic acid a,c-diamide synthase